MTGAVVWPVSESKFCGEMTELKLWRRPAGRGAAVAPPSRKLPSHVPELLSLAFPEFPADEKYSTPSAATSFTAWMTTPAFVFDTMPAACPS